MTCAASRILFVFCEIIYRITVVQDNTRASRRSLPHCVMVLHVAIAVFSRPGGGLYSIDSMPDLRKKKPKNLVSDLVRHLFSPTVTCHYALRHLMVKEFCLLPCLLVILSDFFCLLLVSFFCLLFHL